MHFTASLKFCMRRSRGKFWGAKLFARKNVRTKCENTWEWRENIFFDRTKFRENTWPEIPPPLILKCPKNIQPEKEFELPLPWILRLIEIALHHSNS